MSSPPPSVSCILLPQLRALESITKIQGPLELLQSRHTTNTLHQKHLYTIEWININD